MEEMNQDFVEIDLREYFNILWAKKWIIIGFAALALIVSFVFSNRMTRIYQSSTLVMIEEDGGMEALFTDGMMGGFGSRSNKAATYTQILKSRRILDGVIQKLDLRDEESGEYIRTSSLRNNVSISSGGDTNLLTITADYPDPVIAKEIANTLVSTFQRENQRINQANLTGASDFINDQLTEVEDNLIRLENSLLEYKDEHGVIYPSKQGEASLNRLFNLEMGIAEGEVELKQAKASLAEVENNLERKDAQIVSSRNITENPIIRSSKARLADLEIELVGLLENYTDNHPQVRQLRTKIKELESRIGEEVNEIVSSRTESVNPLYRSLEADFIQLQTKIIASKVKLEAYKDEVASLEGKVSVLPKRELDLARLQRETKIAETLYTMLMERREEINIQRAMQSSDMIVIDEAIINENPISPRIKLNMAIALVLAIFIAVGIIFLIEFLDTTVKDANDIERLTGLPVLGITPDLGEIDHSQGYGRGDM
ncbi:GumC family protein [Halonatronum saccharophilum]|uniref:GumC family protein n=1 Tax=Halonatronum saccharophilum TaxID=150060 RepID=UPI000489EB46|nr:Wzz/FepE/Etk N-terminal domain-containing protein [Halonatronum saccharophilum]